MSSGSSDQAVEATARTARRPTQGTSGSLAQNEARTAQDERKDQGVRDGLGGDAADGGKATGRRGCHFESLRRGDAGNGSLHGEEGEECDAGKVFGGEDADWGETSGGVAARDHQ